MSTESNSNRQKQYLSNLFDPSFQGVNKPFVLSFEDNAQRISYQRYFFHL